MIHFPSLLSALPPPQVRSAVVAILESFIGVIQGAQLSTVQQASIVHCSVHEGGVKSTPSLPRLRVGVILTDPEPVSDSFQLN